MLTVWSSCAPRSNPFFFYFFYYHFSSTSSLPRQGRANSPRIVVQLVRALLRIIQPRLLRSHEDGRRETVTIEQNREWFRRLFFSAASGALRNRLKARYTSHTTNNEPRRSPLFARVATGNSINLHNSDSRISVHTSRPRRRSVPLYPR